MENAEFVRLLTEIRDELHEGNKLQLVNAMLLRETLVRMDFEVQTVVTALSAADAIPEEVGARLIASRKESDELIAHWLDQHRKLAHRYGSAG